MNNNSKFAQHLLENEHPIGFMEKAADIMQITSKGRMLDTSEKFYIYKETKRNNQINDKFTVKPNVIFDILVHKDPQITHTSSQQPDHLHVAQL
jgi:hypothetical protein